jgi:hypothetical protein
MRRVGQVAVVGGRGQVSRNIGSLTDLQVEAVLSAARVRALVRWRDGRRGARRCQDGSVIKRIKVCMNGGRARGEYPAVPVTAGELATAAAAAVAAGAEAVHLHPRDGGGAESLRVEDVAAAVTAVRRLARASRSA